MRKGGKHSPPFISLVLHTGGQWFKSTIAHHLFRFLSFKKFTRELLEKFIASRPDGYSKRTVEFYQYTLTGFIGYTLSPEGVSSYVKSFTCGNDKGKFYRALKTPAVNGIEPRLTSSGTQAQG